MMRIRICNMLLDANQQAGHQLLNKHVIVWWLLFACMAATQGQKKVCVLLIRTLNYTEEEQCRSLTGKPCAKVQQIVG